MIAICVGPNGKYLFKESTADSEVLLDLNLLEEQLEAGRQEDLKQMFETLMKSVEFQNANENIKGQIEWASQTINAYKVVPPGEAEEQEEEEEDLDLLNPEQISRYPEVHQTNKFLDENIVKIRARVQLLQMTEQRNLMKAQSMETKTKQVYQCKFNRLQKEQLRRKYLEAQQRRILQKKEEITAQRRIHQQILSQTRGLQGKAIQERQSQTRDLKERLLKDYSNTKRAVEYENQLSYQRIKKMEAEHQEKLQKFFFDKQINAQQNYQKKVENELQIQQKKQDEFDQLEKLENSLLERIKATQKIYLDSTRKLEKMRSIPFQEISTAHGLQ